MDPIEIETPEWPDTGTEPANISDVSYQASEQPIAEWDNWWNYQTSQSLNTLQQGINEVREGLPEGSLADRYVEREDPVIDGALDLNGYDLIDGARTVWNASNGYIQQSALQNDGIEINAGNDMSGGGRVRLGNTIRLDVNDVWVRDSGDTMTGNLHVEDSNVDIDTDRSHAPLNVRKHNRGSDQYIYTYDSGSSYNAVFVNHNDGTEYATAGVGFSTSTDQADQSPGAAVTYRRTGAWGAGELNLQTKDEESQSGNCSRRVTVRSDGEVDLYNNGVVGFVHETRTSDPASAPAGRMWFRTDEDTS